MNTYLNKIALGLALVASSIASTVSAQTTPQDANPIHSVSLTENGAVEGQVSFLNGESKIATNAIGMDVFFVQDGKIVARSKTEADGSFAINGLAEGQYSVFAAGQSTIAAYGVTVTKEISDQTPSYLNINPISAKYAGIRALIKNSVPRVVAQSVTEPASVISNEPSTTVIKNQIKLVNGHLRGNVSSVVGGTPNPENTFVHLLQNDQPIAQVQTDQQGRFSIPDLESGVYDFIAVSQDSFTAARFEALGNNGASITQISLVKIPRQLDASLSLPAIQEDPINSFPGNNVFVEPAGSFPLELTSESTGFGGAAGSVGGATGNFSGVGGGGGLGRVLRAGGRRGGGFGRLLSLGGLGVALGTGIDGADPAAASPATP